MDDQAAPASALQADRLTIVRAGALLFGAGSLLSAVTLPIPHSDAVDDAGFLGLTIAAALLALALAILGTRIPRWVLPVLPALGSVLCALSVAFADPVTDNEILFVFLDLWSVLFFATGMVVANVAFAGVAYALALGLQGSPEPVPRWAATMVALSVMAAVILALRRRLDAVIAGQALDARTDVLTGLPNRRAFDEALAAELARTARTGRGFSLLAMDLDRFKAVNDRHGHAAGDRVLRRAAGVLRGCAREADRIARPGGEEFALLMPETTGAAAAAAAERVRAAIAATFADDDVPLTISIGVATHPDDGRDAAALQAAADQRLYAAKRSGRDRVVGFSAVAG